MAGESLFRRAMSAIGDIGILTPESRAVQADIAKQRAQRYANFMESIPGAKGKFNLAPDAAPVIRDAQGKVRVLPKGADIPKDAQVLNKTRAEIDSIVYNRPKEYDPHVVGALGAGAVATPAILAAQTATPDSAPTQVPPAAEQPYVSPDGVATYGASGPAQEMRFPPSRSQDTLPSSPAPSQATQSPQAVQAARELLESRLDRARASDAPTDIGSPMGNMAFPHNIPPQAQMPAPAPARQSRPSPVPMPPRRSDVLGTTGGESAASSYGGNPFRAAWSDGLQGGTYGAPDDRYVGAFAQAVERERKLREAGDGESPAMARGGAAQGKGMNGRDAALHKALEIIHHMLTRR